MFALIYLCPQQNILPPQTYLGAQNGGNGGNSLFSFAPTPFGLSFYALEHT